MVNDQARADLSTQDQNLLVERLRERSARRSDSPFEIELLDGQRCRVHAKNLDDQNFATVARLQRNAQSALASGAVSRPSPPPPGIGGSSTALQKCARALHEHYRNNAWALLGGEAGTGKSALARAIHRSNNPSQQVHALDMRTVNTADWKAAEDTATQDSGSLLVVHLDDAGPSDRERLRHILTEAATEDRRIWVAATRSHPTTHGFDDIANFFTQTIEVPPLRHRIDDLDEIAALLLRRATKRAGANFTTDALHVLKRRSWPGNVAELADVIGSVARKTNDQLITAEHLPAQCFSQNRRVLTPLESMERDAVVASLTEHGGNRSRAARAIGISRATIYRKINDYGIAIPPQP
nr:helix-turn-helix domain-containing protein [Saccharopolyspora sp. HNM0983]